MIVAPPPPRPTLHFAAAPGWRTGAGRAPGRYGYDAAWTANVDDRDAATADPPNHTLAHLQGRQVIVFASLRTGSPLPPVPPLATARRFACCEGATPGWPYLLELDRGRLIVRVYFGRRPDASLRAVAERRLRVLEAGQ